MAKNGHFALGRFLLQIALGVMLVVSGIMAFQGKGDAAASAIKSILNGDAATIAIYAVGAIELLAGIFLVIELFTGDRFGKLDNFLMIVVMIVWIVAIVLIDFLGKSGILNSKFSLTWLYNLASHVLVLGALIYLRD